ncbi:MAG: right-handed parallel beta-helix repeat-containing protein [Planctomycetota bacterium]
MVGSIALRSAFVITAVSLALLSFVADYAAADVYVSPAGTSDGSGTVESSYDLASVLAGQQGVDPGDTVFLLNGTYRHPERDQDRPYQVKLQGEEGRPIHVRPAPGAHACIDNRIEIVAPTRHCWLWDLEVTVSEVEAMSPRERQISQRGSHPTWKNIHSGGLHILGGVCCKYINLVVHDNLGNGVSFWRGATDSELYGCLIYDNGWIAPDRYHGPGIYTQNQDGMKRITDCLIFANYSTTIQAYGSSRAWVDHYRIVGNVAFDPLKEGGRHRILVGGGRPSRDIVVSQNICHEVPIQIGYGSAGSHGTEITVTDNVIVRGDLNIAAPSTEVTQTGNVVWNAGDERPDELTVFLRPNKYTEGRANLAIVNWRNRTEVAVDVAGVLADGRDWRLMNPYDFFGQPVAMGTVGEGKITVPLGGEFAAFVLLAAPVADESDSPTR